MSTSSPPSSRRVVITGMGLISPVGLNVHSAWAALLAGQSGIRPISLFPTENFRVKIAGEAWGFDPLNYLTGKEARRADRNVQFALAAAQEALRQAGLTPPLQGTLAEATGTLIGSGAGGIWTYVTQQEILNKHGPQRLSPMLIPMIVTDSASVQVSIWAGACGPNFGVSSACSTGADALGTALETILRGDADVMITGGAEAAVTQLGIGGFDQLNALSRRNEAPAAAARPFDAQRDGFVLSEGAGILVIEALNHALARGAEPLAEVLAYAATCDAAHFTNPDEGAGQAGRAITRVLQKAGVPPTEVDYINAHATATPLGDVFEVRAVKRAFGDHAYRLAISSTKSSTGHLLGAAGAAEAIFCAQALRTGWLPPTINYENPDPTCDLDVVPNTPRETHPRIALSNSFGFGGHNSMVLFKKWEGQ